MHIVHHLAGRELSTRLPISVDQIYRQIELKVMRVVEELRAAGYPIIEFQWSRKTQDSLITKLLAKRSTLAANIYDKLRFRLIVRTPEDLLPMLVALHRRLIPFNYVVPGESVNHLLPFRRVLEPRALAARLEPLLQHDTDPREAAGARRAGADQRVLGQAVQDRQLRGRPAGAGRLVRRRRRPRASATSSSC